MTEPVTLAQVHSVSGSDAANGVSHPKRMKEAFDSPDTTGFNFESVDLNRPMSASAAFNGVTSPQFVEQGNVDQFASENVYNVPVSQQQYLGNPMMGSSQPQQHHMTFSQPSSSVGLSELLCQPSDSVSPMASMSHMVGNNTMQPNMSVGGMPQMQAQTQRQFIPMNDMNVQRMQGRPVMLGAARPMYDQQGQQRMYTPGGMVGGYQQPGMVPQFSRVMPIGQQRPTMPLPYRQIVGRQPQGPGGHFIQQNPCVTNPMNFQMPPAQAMQFVNQPGQGQIVPQPASMGSPLPPAQPPSFAPSPASAADRPRPDRPSQDAESRIKLIQHQLVLLIHAYKCSRPNPNQQQHICTLPHCDIMKKVLHHMNECKEGRQCQFAHCASSRQIINHWRNCQKTDCPVCADLRQEEARKSSSHVLPDSVPDSNTQENQLTTSVLSNGQIPGESPAVVPTPINAVTEPSFDDLARLNPKISVQPHEPEQRHDWHMHVHHDLRQYLIKKIVAAIFPHPDENAYKDERTVRIFKYARDVEQNTYSASSDKEQYYLRLAEKIYQIQKADLTDEEEAILCRDLEEKHRSRQPANPAISASSTNPSDTPLMTARGHLVNELAIAAQARELQNFEGNAANRSAMEPGFIKSEVGLIKSEPSLSPFRGGNSMEVKVEQVEVKQEVVEPRQPPPVPAPVAQPPSNRPPKDVKRDEYTPENLRRKLMPILEKLFRQHPESGPFRSSVAKEEAPDYYDIVKNPMDLAFIKEKLDTAGRYSNPWQFCDDIWLMFENAWLYNKKNSKIYKWCSKLAEIFEKLMDPLMQGLGYCCARKYYFNPQVLCCMGQSQTICSIGRDVVYYKYEDKYLFCEKCFNDVKGDEVEVTEISDDHAIDPLLEKRMRIEKRKFEHARNSVIQYEEFEYCQQCGKKWHRICALYLKQISPHFECEECRKKRGRPKKANRFSARRLPTTYLGDHIEMRCKKLLADKGENMGDVIVRVLSSTDKQVDVKEGMRAHFPDMPDKYKYRSKAIFAFQEIDGVDVMFFGMHVQEYDGTVPSPNSRRVYISYLDSVKFFRPRELRTAVYHEILIAYLEYAKKLGYIYGHIWACPPGEGDDYIFHCHPGEQKIPKPKLLQKWYKNMLDQATMNGIVIEYRDCHKDCTEGGPKPLSSIPYFDGDFWPNTLEELIKEVDQEDAKRKELEAGTEGVGIDEDSNCGIEEVDESGKKKSTVALQRKKSKSKIQRKGTSKKASESDLTTKVYSTMDKFKESFFTIRLFHPESSACQDRPDPDSLIACELMDGRDQFLAMCRENHHEFSSLRRAKYSTMAVLFQLHMAGKGYTCNKCGLTVVTLRYHCSICDDFDLCMTCNEKEGQLDPKDKHPHPLEKVGSGDDHDEGTAERPDNRVNMVKFIAYLEHASQCRDANCHDESCLKFKRFITHMHSCKRKMEASCETCRKLIAVAYYHAKKCQQNKCQVPFCQHLRNRWRSQNSTKNNTRFMNKRRQMMERLQQQNAGPAPVSTSQTQPAVTTTVSPAPAPVESPRPTVPAAALQAVAHAKNAAQAQGMYSSPGRNIGSPPGQPTPQYQFPVQSPQSPMVGKPVPQQSLQPRQLLDSLRNMSDLDKRSIHDTLKQQPHLLDIIYGDHRTPQVGQQWAQQQAYVSNQPPNSPLNNRRYNYHQSPQHGMEQAPQQPPEMYHFAEQQQAQPR